MLCSCWQNCVTAYDALQNHVHNSDVTQDIVMSDFAYFKTQTTKINKSKEMFVISRWEVSLPNFLEISN